MDTKRSQRSWSGVVGLGIAAILTLVASVWIHEAVVMVVLSALAQGMMLVAAIDLMMAIEERTSSVRNHRG